MENDKEFDLNGALDRLAARVCREIKSDRRRQTATVEFRAHLEDAIEDIMRKGIPPEAAYAELARSLGNTDKLCTLLAAVHNTRHIPVLLPWLVGAALLGWLVYLYHTTDSYSVYAWIRICFQFAAMGGVIVLGLIASKWIRAIRKRTSALRRLQKYVKENGGTMIRRRNCYKSLLVRTSTPELIVDMEDRRYILSFWATVNRRRTLHLQDNGIYRYDKHFGYMLITARCLPWSRFLMLYPASRDGSQQTPLAYSEIMKIPQSEHLMPNVNYGDCFVPGKVNIPVFLLNPIPMDIEICENGRIHKLVDGDVLPDTLGGARLYSMSSLLSLMEEIRIFGREEGKRVTVTPEWSNNTNPSLNS